MAQARVEDVCFTDTTIIMALDDGRALAAPLTWFPRLLGASAKKRAIWKIGADGTGVTWPALDEDIALKPLLTLQSCAPQAEAAKSPVDGDEGHNGMVEALNAFVEDRRRNAKPNTFQAQHADIKKFLAWHSETGGPATVEAWEPAHTRAFVEAMLDAGLSRQTVDRIRATLRAFEAWFRANRHCPWADADACPATSMHAKDATPTPKSVGTPALSTIDLQRAIAAVDRIFLEDLNRRKDSSARRNRALFYLLLQVRIRPAELLNLRLDQWRDGVLEDVVDVRSGSKVDYFVPSPACEYLEDYIDNERSLRDPKGTQANLFVTRTGEGLGGNLARQVLHPYFNKVSDAASEGLEGHRVHVTSGVLRKVQKERKGTVPVI